jgi:hypothetical protein
MLLKKAACAESKPRCVLLAALVRRDRAPTWCRHASQHTMSRTWVAAALSNVADPDSDFTVGGPPVAFWPL